MKDIGSSKSKIKPHIDSKHLRQRIVRNDDTPGSF